MPNDALTVCCGCKRHNRKQGPLQRRAEKPKERQALIQPSMPVQLSPSPGATAMEIRLARGAPRSKGEDAPGIQCAYCRRKISLAVLQRPKKPAGTVDTVGHQESKSESEES